MHNSKDDAPKEGRQRRVANIRSTDLGFHMDVAERSEEASPRRCLQEGDDAQDAAIVGFDD